MRLRGLLLCGCAAVAPVRLSAQCPDGSPPPCTRAAAARTAPAIDPNRIAILPFRVAAADTLLGEGMAELLATEFTGEGGPRAVDMGTVLRAWRRAGGGLRTPLTQAEAMRLAREMGAGLLAVGSVIGLGSRITVTAALYRVPAGEERGRTEPLSGPSDSLEPLVRRLTIGLLAAAGSRAQADRRTRLSESPTAMRAYMEGLVSWRRGRSAEAGAAFERAYSEDSLFARAAFMRYLAGSWYELNSPALTRWAQRTWARRGQLSARDQVLLHAFLGSDYPRNRPLTQILSDRRGAVAELPESPEAWYLLGDLLYHVGAALDIRDAIPQAIAAFGRSLALDSQQTVFTHLIQAALMGRDTALLRRAWPAYERADSAGDRGSLGWLVGHRIGDAATVARARRRGTGGGGLYYSGWGLSAALTDELRDTMLARASTPAGRATVHQYYATTALIQGRPGASKAVPITGDEEAQLGQRMYRVAAAIYADGDSLDAVAALREIDAMAARSDNARGARSCILGLWRLHQGVAPEAELELLRSAGNRGCADIIRLLDAVRTGASDLDGILTEVDSLFRARVISLVGIENIALARGWEARGDYRRAASAARIMVEGQGTPSMTRATGARMEGRLLLMAGDTTGAIAAYQRYLDLRRDAEPVLVPQRDSVQAELARLLRPRT